MPTRALLRLPSVRVFRLPDELRGRPALAAYIAALALVASLVLAGALPHLSPRLLGLVLALGVLGALGSLVNIDFPPVSRHDVASFPNMIAVVLLPGPEAVAAAVTGALGGELVLRRRWVRLLFNLSQLTITYAVTAGLWAYAGPPPVTAASLLDRLPLLMVVLPLRLVMNHVLVAVVAALAADRPFWATFLAGQRAHAPVELGLSAMGVLAAFSWLIAPRALVLLIVPAVMGWTALRGVGSLTRSAERWAALAELSARLAEPAAPAKLIQIAADLVSRFGADAVRIDALGHTTTATVPDLSPPVAARLTAALADPSGVHHPRTAILPLVAHGATIGELRVASLPSRRQPDEPAFLEAAAERIAVALHNALLTQEAAQVETLRAVSDAKSDLLAAVSHELHPPLALVVAYGQLLDQTVADPDARAIAGKVTATGQHLTGLVDDLLDAARLETGRYALKRRPIDLRPLAESALQSARATHPGVDFVLRSPPEPIIVDADPARLLQVLSNLLSNAAKYGPGDGTVRLVLESSPGTARLAVEDDGPGVLPADRDRVFEKFHRGRTDVPGLGLGLSIARDLVLAHGGVIRIEDAATAGVRFVIELPRVGM
jgi:signal transduction histidine kinase